MIQRVPDAYVLTDTRRKETPVDFHLCAALFARLLPVRLQQANRRPNIGLAETAKGGLA